MTAPAYPAHGASNWDAPGLKAWLDASVTFVNVMQQGATGDGVTDDTTAIHASRTAAGVGATLYFPPGTYMVNQLTASVASQTWHLAPGATIKGKSSATSYILRVTGADVTIRGGTLDGSALSAGTMDNPFQSQAAGTLWDGVKVTGSTGYGIVSFDVSRQTVRNCWFVLPAYEAVFFKNSSTGPANITDMFALGNYVDCTAAAGTNASGITAYGDTGKTISRFKAIGNTIIMPVSPANGASGGVGAVNCTDFTIADNVVTNSNIAISVPNAVNGTISGNTIKGFNVSGIELPVTATSVTVANNNIDGNNLGVSGVAATGTLVGVAIVGNTMRNFAGAGQNTIYMGPCTSVTITGNTIQNTSGVFNRSAINFTQSATSVTVAGNIFDGGADTFGTGIQFLSSIDGLTITSNAFTNLSRFTIFLAMASGNIDNVTVVGNTKRNCPTGYSDSHYGTSTAGTNFTVHSNGELANSVADGWNLAVGTGTGTQIGTSTSQKLGFYGTTPAAKGAALTAAPSAAPAGGTGTAAGGWDTAAHRDSVITTINTTLTRLNDLVSRLQALGLIT